MRAVEELTADVPPKDAIPYRDLASSVFGYPVTPARVKSVARACRRLADAAVVELWLKLDWRQRGRPPVDVELTALRASLSPDEIDKHPEVFTPLDDEEYEYLTNLREQAHAGEVGAIRELFTYEPPVETGTPTTSLSWVAAVSRPLNELERKRLKRAYEEWRAGIGDWQEISKREATLEAAFAVRRKLNELAIQLNREDWNEARQEAVRGQIRDHQAKVRQTIAENQIDSKWVEEVLAAPDPFEAIGIVDNALQPREGLFRYLRHL